MLLIGGGRRDCCDPRAKNKKDRLYIAGWNKSWCHRNKMSRYLSSSLSQCKQANLVFNHQSLPHPSDCRQTAARCFLLQVEAAYKKRRPMQHTKYAHQMLELRLAVNNAVSTLCNVLALRIAGHHNAPFRVSLNARLSSPLTRADSPASSRASRPNIAASAR